MAAARAPASPAYLSASSMCCRLKSSDGTILSMCCGSQILACNSSFTVFLTTPCRPLMPDILILEEKGQHGVMKSSSPEKPGFCGKGRSTVWGPGMHSSIQRQKGAHLLPSV